MRTAAGGAAARRLRRPLAGPLLLTAAWHAVLVVAAALVPRVGTSDLRAAVVNLVALSVPVAALAVLHGWRAAGVARLSRRRALLVPLVVVAVLPLAAGVSAAPGALLGVVVLQVCLATDEELLSRGYVQSASASLGPWRCAILVAVLFEAGHLLNAVFFGSSWYDAGAQTLTVTASGFCFAAARFHVLSLWPLVALHAVENVLRDASHALPAVVEAGSAAALVAYGAWLLRGVERDDVAEVALQR